MNKSRAREYALMVLYSKDINPESNEIILDSEKPLSNEDKPFADLLVSTVHENAKSIDEKIIKYLKNWSIEQLNTVDKNILRLAIAEFDYDRNAPDRKVIINEAIELAKEYGGENSYRFINGILNAALQESNV